LAQPPQGEGVSSASRQINMAHDTGLHFISFHISHFPTHKTTHPKKKGWQTVEEKPNRQNGNWKTGSSQVAQRLLNFQVQPGSSSFRRSSWKLDMKMKGAEGREWVGKAGESGGKAEEKRRKSARNVAVMQQQVAQVAAATFCCRTKQDRTPQRTCDALEEIGDPN